MNDHTSKRVAKRALRRVQNAADVMVQALEIAAEILLCGIACLGLAPVALYLCVTNKLERAARQRLASIQS